MHGRYAVLFLAKIRICLVLEHLELFKDVGDGGCGGGYVFDD